MKKLLLSVVMLYGTSMLYAQRVGIGTVHPQEMLHVAGDMWVEDNLIAYQNGTVQSNLLIGGLDGAANAKLRVASGITRTDTLTAGGVGFPGKLFSVYGDAQVSENTLAHSLQVIGDGVVSGSARIDGRIGINGPTNASYGLVVNNAASNFQGDIVVTGNNRINGRLGVSGATHASYGLIVNNANSYLQGSATISADAVVNGNSRVGGILGINGYPNTNYGLMVNNAHSFFQGNLTVTGNLNAQSTSAFGGQGSVLSNGSSPIRIHFLQYHINAAILGSEDSYNTFSIPEFGPNVDDIRVSVFQYVDEYNDPLYSNPNDFRWWISDINPDENTARIRFRNLAFSSRALRGDFYILVMIRD